MINKCPYCKKTNEVPEVAFTNVEYHGSKAFNLRCSKCKKIFIAYISRITKLDYTAPSEATYTDF